MKFLLDMGILPELVSKFRFSGYDAVHLHDEGLGTLPDPDILRKAATEQYVLLTHDLDFAELVAASGARLPSVIIFRLRNMRPENVWRYLQAVTRQCSNALVTGAIVSVTENAIRVRKLPLRR